MLFSCVLKDCCEYEETSRSLCVCVMPCVGGAEERVAVGAISGLVLRVEERAGETVWWQ